MEDKKIRKIQKFGKNILLKKLQDELKVSSLYTVETKSFAQFRKVQRSEDNINLMKRFQKLFRLEYSDLKVIDVGLLISQHPTNLFGDNVKQWHPHDDLMYKQSEILMINLIELDDYEKLKSFLEQYINNFKKWKEGDKHRTMEGIIISFHYRMEHLEKIRDNDKLNKEQKILMIKELNQQLASLKKSLGMIDPKFPISALETQHNELFEKYKKGWTETFDKVKDVVLESYQNHLIKSIDNGDYSIIQQEFVAISNRILSICPRKILVSLTSKINDTQINKVFEDFSLTNKDLINLLLLYIDTVIMFDAPINDEGNKIWKEELITLFNLELNEAIPHIIIKINQKIDFIINQMKKITNL